ncbi:MAG: NUDIX domain-containing protein [Pseudonocardia sp.]|nr:NUDIX domain-containing protein [Pseudonocardia sp.]
MVVLPCRLSGPPSGRTWRLTRGPWRVDTGETALDAARRELAEELGRACGDEASDAEDYPSFSRR